MSNPQPVTAAVLDFPVPTALLIGSSDDEIHEVPATPMVPLQRAPSRRGSTSRPAMSRTTSESTTTIASPAAVQSVGAVGGGPSTPTDTIRIEMAEYSTPPPPPPPPQQSPQTPQKGRIVTSPPRVSHEQHHTPDDHGVDVDVDDVDDDDDDDVNMLDADERNQLLPTHTMHTRGSGGGAAAGVFTSPHLLPSHLALRAKHPGERTPLTPSDAQSSDDVDLDGTTAADTRAGGHGTPDIDDLLNQDASTHTHTHPIDRPGCDKDGMPILTSIHYFGVIWNYIAVGFYYGTLGSLAYPIFSQVFALKSYRVKGSMQFIMIWWSFKTFLACVSDVFPIRGYRRKYYILVGWVFALLLTILAIALGQPHANDDPVPYVVTFSAMTLAYLLADVACDGMVVDLALNEPIEKRGTIQSVIYIARSIAMAITSTCMAFLFSSEEYGGDFSFGIQLPHYLWILVVVNAIGLYFYWRLADIPDQPTMSYWGQLQAMFQRMKLNAVWHTILFAFFVHLFAYIQNAASYDIQKQFCNVRPVVDGLFNNVLSSMIMAAAIYFTKRYLLNTSWHTILAVTIVLMAILTYIPAILVDFNVIRSQYFYVGAPLMEQVVKGVFFIVSGFVGVELATRSSAAITFGLMTTVSNLTHPLTTALSANLASLFHIYAEDGVTLLDTTDARWQLFKLDTCIFFIQLAALSALVLIPSQKAALQEKLQRGETNSRAAVIITVFLFSCLAYSILTNTLASIESTSCLRIAGGKGC